MEIVSMVLVGKVNKHLVSLINKAGATAVGLSGIDEHLLTSRPSPNSELGFVGDIASVDPSIDIKGVKKMTDDGKVAGGMIPKVSYCVRSMDQGVRTASIIDGRLEHYLLLEILTDEGAGIMITG
ncbi:putative G-type lectin S-receptor-like serine/threonine-protein kinase RLK1-like [Capsicum annuum]|nr:putative G-type lectin S-receptor-like serine/threonine-protein kinase RLK1-like [Capsicum annuum]